MNGTKFISTTLRPSDLVTVSKDKSVWIPDLDCPVVVVVVVVVVTCWPPPAIVGSKNPNSGSPSIHHHWSLNLCLGCLCLPPLDVSVICSSTSIPDQFVSHSFHTVPRIPVSSAIFLNCSNASESSTTTDGLTSVSFHSSESGESWIVPAQLNTLYGFTFENVDA